MIEPILLPRSSPLDGRRSNVVLLVDDQPFIATAVGMLLQSELDIELHCCLHAVNAIALANQIAPTVVLQDLVMPEIDGLTLVRAFRENPLTADVPVIVLSGNDDEDTRARAMAAGAKGYLVKLPTKAELLACIRAYGPRVSAGAQTLDPAAIEQFREAGAPEFTRRLIDQFLQEATSRVHTLAAATLRADADALKATAHALKGSAMIMGAARLAALCVEIEHQLSPAVGGGVSPSLMAEIEGELAGVQLAMIAERDRGARR